MRSALNRFVGWWMARFEEKSTWAGIALIGACAGKNIPASVTDALSFWGPLLAASMIAATTKDGK